MTNLCNGRCSYCDFKDWITSCANVSVYMSLSDLDKVIDWVKESNLEYVQLLGGEPMLHPKILEVVSRLVERGVKIRCLMTNGLGDTRIYESLVNLSGMVWLVNVNTLEGYTKQEWELLNKNLEVLRWKGEDRPIRQEGFDAKSLSLQLSIVFHKTEQEYKYIIELAKRYDCATINYGYSRPCADLSNSHFNLREEAAFKPKLLSFVRDCVNNGIKPLTAYNVHPCTFTTKEMRYLMLFSNVKTEEGMICSPNLEVTPDLNVHYCLPMRGLVRSYRVGSMRALDMMERMLRDSMKYRDRVLPQCTDCKLWEAKKCQGLCLRFKVDDSGWKTSQVPQTRSFTKLKKLL